MCALGVSYFKLCSLSLDNTDEQVACSIAGLAIEVNIMLADGLAEDYCLSAIRAAMAPWLRAVHNGDEKRQARLQLCTGATGVTMNE